MSRTLEMDEVFTADPIGPPSAPAPNGQWISVVIPTCNRPELLGRCLFALASQRLPHADYEIVVVDDGRSELTQRLVATIATELGDLSIRYVRPGTGKGPAAARNTGWQAARGDLIAFTDDDTVPDADWLAEGSAALRGSGCSAIAGRVIVPRPPGVGRAPTDHEKMTRGLEQTSFVTANAFVWRRALQKIDGFDEQFGRAWREDSDLEFRLAEQVGPVGRCERAVVLHPVRPERWGVSLRQQKNAYYEALLYKKHPKRYRAAADGGTPWRYYAIVGLTITAIVLRVLDIGGSAAVAALLALLLVLRFAFDRLRGTSHALPHVIEMIATSAVIPFLSVWWRLRGAWRWKVWFL